MSKPHIGIRVGRDESRPTRTASRGRARPTSLVELALRIVSGKASHTGCKCTRCVRAPAASRGRESGFPAPPVPTESVTVVAAARSAAAVGKNLRFFPKGLLVSYGN